MSSHELTLVLRLSVIFILNLWGEVVSDVTNVSNVVLNHQGDIRRHGEGHLGRQAAGLGEHVQVPEQKNKLVNMMNKI